MEKNEKKLGILFAILAVIAVIIIGVVMVGKKADKAEGVDPIDAISEDAGEDGQSHKTGGDVSRPEDGSVSEQPQDVLVNEEAGAQAGTDDENADSKPENAQETAADVDDSLKALFIVDPETGFPAGIPADARVDYEVSPYASVLSSSLNDVFIYLGIDGDGEGAWYDALTHTDPEVLIDFIEQNFINNPECRELWVQAMIVQRPDLYESEEEAREECDVVFDQYLAEYVYGVRQFMKTFE